MDQIYPVSYNLYAVSDGGTEEFIESTTIENPLIFCSGVGMLLPKFEEQLQERKTDDSFDFILLKSDAYGERHEDLIKDADRKLFEKDGTLDEKIFFIGNTVPLMDTEGHRFNAAVVKIDKQSITFVLNHPLAGKDLHFVGSVIDAHEASEKEIESFTHACGCHGCGGGCGSEDGGCSGEGCGSCCGK